MLLIGLHFSLISIRLPIASLAELFIDAEIFMERNEKHFVCANAEAPFELNFNLQIFLKIYVGRCSFLNTVQFRFFVVINNK